MASGPFALVSSRETLRQAQPSPGLKTPISRSLLLLHRLPAQARATKLSINAVITMVHAQRSSVGSPGLAFRSRLLSPMAALGERWLGVWA